MVIKLFTADYFHSGAVEERGHFVETSAPVVPKGARRKGDNPGWGCQAKHKAVVLTRTQKNGVCRKTAGTSGSAVPAPALPGKLSNPWVRGPRHTPLLCTDQLFSSFPTFPCLLHSPALLLVPGEICCRLHPRCG